MKRKVYAKLLSWKKNTLNKTPLMVLGVRQCGKTYIIDEFCKNEYKNYCKINLLEREDIINIFEMPISSDEKYNLFKTTINFDLEQEDSILFIDEIQESEELISSLKYFCENHNNVNIICAGSLLGVKLKRFNKSFPVGKVKMIQMYPMDFEEFLMANNKNMLLEHIRDCYINNKQMTEVLHNNALQLYKVYLITGGMPSSIKNMIDVNLDYIKYDRSILSDIISSYFKDMKKYVISESESLKIERTYKSIPSQLTNASKKFQFKLISNNARTREYETAIDWLEGSNLIERCECVSNPEIPLKGFTIPNIFKFYLSDVGILNNLLELNINDILFDKVSLYKGVITENYVANQLISNGFNLFYWQSDATSEIDFLVNTKDGIIPIEVKSSSNTQSKSLKVYMEKYNPSYGIRISTKDFGYNSVTKIKSIPLYATYLITSEIF